MKGALTIGTRRAIIAASFASLAVATHLEAQTSQTVMEGKRTPRRIVYPIIGAAVGGLASLVYFWSGPNSLPGTCAGKACVALASLGGGAFVGWLVGKEKDELHALRYKGGMPLKPPSTDVNLAGEPMTIALADTFVAALGGGGAQIVSAGAKPKLLTTRAGGLRQMSDAVLLPGSSEMALTAGGGLYKFPLLTGTGVLLRNAPTSAVVALGNDYIVGAGLRVERVARTASDVGTWPGATLRDSVRALEPDSRGIVWALTETELVALNPAGDSLAILSRTPMPRGAAQRLDLEESLIAVALGDSGVRFVDVHDPAQPKTITDFKDIRFAHDVALLDGKAWIAAGIDGLIKVSLKNGSTPLKEGIARELGFIVSVEAAKPNLWVLDRSGSEAVLKKIPSVFQ